MKASSANEFMRMLDPKDSSYGARHLFGERSGDREDLVKYLRHNHYRPIYDQGLLNILSDHRTAEKDKFAILQSYFEAHPDEYREAVLKSGVLEQPEALREKLRFKSSANNAGEIMRQMRKAGGISEYCFKLDSSNTQHQNAIAYLQLALNLPNTACYDKRTSVQLYQKIKRMLPDRRGYLRSDNDPDGMFRSSFEECVEYVDRVIWRLAGLRDEYLARDGASVWASMPSGKYFAVGKFAGWESAVKYLQSAFLMQSGVPKSGKYDVETARFVYETLRKKGKLPKEAWYFTDPVSALGLSSLPGVRGSGSMNGVRYVDARVWEALGLDLRFLAMNGAAVWKESPKQTEKPGQSASKQVYVTAEQLLAIGWTGVSVRMVDELNRVLERYQITNINSIRHFIAQATHESNDWYKIGYGDGLIEIGTKDYLQGKKYWPYIGAGYIHLTWDYNYQAFSDYLRDERGIDDPLIMLEGPEQIASTYAWESAAWFWSVLTDANEVASHLDVHPDKLSKIVNQYDQASFPTRADIYYNKVVPAIK